MAGESKQDAKREAIKTRSTVTKSKSASTKSKENTTKPRANTNLTNKKLTKKIKSAKAKKVISKITTPALSSADTRIKNMSNKKSKKSAKSKEEIQAEKVTKAELKANEKATKKAKEKEKKAKKSSEKAKQMAKSKSKKREKETTKIQYERRMKREEAVTYFTSLISGLEKGTVQFKQGKETVIMTPSELVDVEIKARTKGNMEKVTFELSWLTTKAQDISISSS